MQVIEFISYGSDQRREATKDSIDGPEPDLEDGEEDEQKGRLKVRTASSFLQRFSPSLKCNLIFRETNSSKLEVPCPTANPSFSVTKVANEHPRRDPSFHPESAAAVLHSNTREH